jgi:hypothetical protein
VGIGNQYWAYYAKQNRYHYAIYKIVSKAHTFGSIGVGWSREVVEIHSVCILGEKIINAQMYSFFTKNNSYSQCFIKKKQKNFRLRLYVYLCTAIIVSWRQLWYYLMISQSQHPIVVYNRGTKNTERFVCVASSQKPTTQSDNPTPALPKRGVYVPAAKSP